MMKMKTRYSFTLLIRTLLVGLFALVLQFAMAQQSPDKAKQLTIKARERAEAVARKILNSETLPTTSDQGEVEMPVGWEPKIWNKVSDEDRPIVIRMAKQGWVSGLATKPKWILSKSRLEAIGRMVEEGKVDTHALPLSAGYYCQEFGSMSEARKMANAEKSGDETAKKKRAAIRAVYNANYVNLWHRLNQEDIFQKLVNFQKKYPGLFR